MINKKNLILIIIILMIIPTIYYVLKREETTPSTNYIETTSSRSPVYIGSEEDLGYGFSPIPNKVYSKMLFTDLSATDWIKINSTNYCISDPRYEYSVKCAYDVLNIARKYMNRYSLNMTKWSLYLIKIVTYSDEVVDYIWSLTITSSIHGEKHVESLGLGITSRKGVIISFGLEKYYLLANVSKAKLIDPQEVIVIASNISDINIEEYYGRVKLVYSDSYTEPAMDNPNIYITEYRYTYQVFIDNFSLGYLGISISMKSNGLMGVYMELDYPLLTLDKHGFSSIYCKLDKDRIRDDIIKVMGLERFSNSEIVDLEIDIYRLAYVIISDNDLYLAPTYHVNFEVDVIIEGNEYVYYGDIIYFASNCEIYDYDYWLS